GGAGGDRVTNSFNQYEFSLPPGTYNLTATLDGVGDKGHADGIQVTAGTQLSVPIVIQD
ncbi:MAG: hypothetical protein JOZ15_20910, partial [Acidobacteria bacterium]|nr:hypothetical protein [Acidobacteriota bacterium]